MTSALEAFISGYHRQRGDSEWPTPEGPFPREHTEREYWLGNRNQWWTPDRSWAVADRALGQAEIGNFQKIEVLFAEVQRMWAVLQSSHPYAVWDAYTWKWLVARRIPVPEPGPGPQPGPEPGQPPVGDPKAKRRAQRDARIAEVNAMFSRGEIPRAVRDDRIVLILDEYSDLN